MLFKTLLFTFAFSFVFAEQAERFEYKAKADKLRRMLTNSIYSKKETFLRELLSNANDALEKFRIEALTKPALKEGDERPLSITLNTNKEGRQLILEDNGIGMTKDDLVKYLGTIAESGTSKLLENAESSNMIGQFGIGFYSAFIVADKVQVFSKTHEDKQAHVWEGLAESPDFTVKSTSELTHRGTRIVLHLKEGNDEFLEPDNLAKTAKEFAEFFSYPIYLRKMVQVEVKEEEENKEEEEGEGKKEEGKEKEEETKEKEAKKDKEAEKKEKKYETKEETQLLNSKKPLWLRPTNQIAKEEYIEFYKSYFGDYQEPLGWIHFQAEGDLRFNGLLFIPSHSDVDLLKSKDPVKEIRVLARHVFVEKENYLPHAFSFCKGVIDFEDVSMNVSRESFQNKRLLISVGKTITRKFFEAISGLEGDKMDKFLKAFSLNLKYEAANSETNRNRIFKVLKFLTSKAEDKGISLEEYVERNKESPSIFFASGDSVSAIKKAPFFEKYANDEVIFATDPIDEFLFQSLDKFEEKKLVNIAKDEESDAGVSQEDKDKFGKFLTHMKSELKSDVSDVKLNSKLSSSPFSVLASKHGWTGTFERLIKAQSGASNNPMLSFMGFQKKVLEVNPKHPFVLELLESFDKGIFGSKGSPGSRIIFDMALMKSGYDIPNVDGFVKRTQDLMSNFMKAQAQNQEIKLSLDEAELEDKEAKKNNPFADMPDMPDMDSLGKFNDDLGSEEENEGEELKSVSEGSQEEQSQSRDQEEEKDASEESSQKASSGQSERANIKDEL